MKKLATIAALALSCMGAHAAYMDGNKLLTDMKSESAVDRALTIGYVLGVSDAMDGIFFCVPGGVTVGQMKDIVQVWLVSNPSQRHNAGDLIVAAALKAVWPCAKTPQERQQGW